MNENNKNVVARLVASIDKFAAGAIELDDMQHRLQTSMNLLEADGSESKDLIRLAEVDIDEIQFTMLRDEQRPAALFRLDELRAALLKQVDDG